MAKTVVGKKYNPYTGKWEDVYGDTSGNSGGNKKQTPKQDPSKKPKTTPNKPPTADKGNDNRGSGEKNQEKNVEKVRAMEYDLEGTAEVRPIVNIRARTVVNFQGLGKNFNGNYFLATVIHTINRSGYSQSLEVLRSNFTWKKDPLVKAPKTNPPPKKQEPKKEANPTKYYTIKKGDTLWAIAKRYYGNGALYPKIFNANKDKIKNPNLIYPNQKIKIPPK